MPVNVSPEYAHAEKKYSNAQTEEDLMFYLEEMIKHAPAHKGGESLRANLRTRLKKMKEKAESKAKGSSGGGTKQNIRKEEMQAVLAGFPNVGKSFIFEILTGQKTIVSDVPFSTYQLTPGMIKFEDIQIQLIDMPPFPNEDKSMINNADTLLIIIDRLNQINESEKYISRASGNRIYIYTKIDLLSDAEKRKLEATIKSKYKNLVCFMISNKTSSKEEINALKKRIFETFPIIRVYTKEPRKESTGIPMVMKRGSTTKNVAERILKGMSTKIKKTKIWGPSSKFPGQMVGIGHILKDKDTIEFQTI